MHAPQPPRAPPTAAAAAFALPQPTVHGTHGLTCLVRAALAVVRAAEAPPASRRQGSGPPSGAPGVRGAAAAVAAFARRHRCAQAAGNVDSVCRGVAAVHGAREAAAAACDVVGRSLSGALALVPVWGARDGHETATVRAPRRLGGGSRRVKAGLGVVAGCAGDGQTSARASQRPPWPPPRVNMRACNCH